MPNPVLLQAAATILVSGMIAKYIIDSKNKIKRKKNRKTWTRNWLKARSNGLGILNMVNNELLIEDPNSYRNFLRLDYTQFEFLLSLIENKIGKQDTVMRESIPARNRLEVTLRFLATGETFRSLMYSTRIHETTISKIVAETCAAIIFALQPLYLQTPNCAEDWKRIAQDFENMWQFPLCIGALDGRHITFRAPLSSGSYFYNYKGDNSIVLLGLVDAHYKFMYINIGMNGRVSDGGIFRNSKLSSAIYNNTLNIPDDELLPGMTERLPYVVVADDAFPLSKHIMKPYSYRGLDNKRSLFNYRLSRARRIVENAFGILANRFRILLNPINLGVEKVQSITHTCVLLHNFLTTENHAYINLEDDIQQLPRLEQQSGNRTSNDARHIRDLFANYFSGESD